MKLAVSNIAWSRHDDPTIFAMLRELGVKGIEIAPTMVWPRWQGAEPSAAEAYRRRLAAEGFEVPALQAILFGKEELQLFLPERRHQLMDHFAKVAGLAEGLGAKILVFGSPKNRRRGNLTSREAFSRAANLLAEIGEICAARGVFLGIEPNPVEYGCDFITNVADAKELLELTNHPHVRLHLDAGGMALTEGNNIGGAIASAGGFIHYHASEPMLADFTQPAVDHAAAGESLRRMGYAHWISIEMRRSEPESATIRNAVRQVQDAYFPAGAC